MLLELRGLQIELRTCTVAIGMAAGIDLDRIARILGSTPQVDG